MNRPHLAVTNYMIRTYASLHLHLLFFINGVKVQLQVGIFTIIPDILLSIINLIKPIKEKSQYLTLS